MQMYRLGGTGKWEMRWALEREYNQPEKGKRSAPPPVVVKGKLSITVYTRSSRTRGR